MITELLIAGLMARKGQQDQILPPGRRGEFSGGGLLLSAPGISLPNWLAIARVFGVKMALVYVPVIIATGTLMGWFFGNFIF